MPLGIDWASIIQAILFFLFAGLTALVSAVVGPTYDQLLVPELSPAALYPPLVASTSDPSNYLAGATSFSTYTLANIVDPAIALVALGVAICYLARASIARWANELDALLPRLVIAVVAANFTVPIAGAILAVGAGLYPVLAGWDGGAWQHWVNLAGIGQGKFSWDNGALAFVLSLVEFFLVFGLVLAVGLRDALLAVLLVLLPIFTLLWPFRPLAPLARRAWFLFVELVFLPCVLIVPLELAVGSPTIVLLVGYLGCALASPYLLSLAGTHLTAFGFPGSASAIGGGAQRGLAAAPTGVSGYAAPSAAPPSTGSAGRQAASGALRVAGSASAPVALPLAAAQVAGHGAAHLVRHLQSRAKHPNGPGRWPAVDTGYGGRG
ncbi:MAG TPA: hypothetical protein VMC82_01805 [Thermoplasmata archaeon]|nr:hypothetical protein [Thermoplasmata archaeon]